MEYNHREVEFKWQKWWEQQGTYKVKVERDKPKYYVLDMFPYPSGAGLHVGHPLGYIATDILSRYKKLTGYNVLHPMGFDAFGLPAEQYAIQTGQHPAQTTNENIKRYKEQLRLMGFNYDWSREVQTRDPQYYKWTQWIFLQLYKSWYNPSTNRAEPVETLLNIFESEGNEKVKQRDATGFTAAEWKDFPEKRQQEILLSYRLAYLAWSEVNWCPALGTVLANDEVVNGVSERGGHPVVKKKMRQWFLRITAYADRLLEGLEKIDWPEPLKEMQRNWIGRSEGAMMNFRVEGMDRQIRIFTTRPDTVFGSTFMVLAPEHELVAQITAEKQQPEIEEYKEYVQGRSERERVAEVKKVTGAFTGAFAVNPFTEEKIPVYISEYVLGGYGTGAIMAVPGHDERDHRFAKKFGLPILQVIEGPGVMEEANPGKEGKLINSGLLNGLEVQEAIEKILSEMEYKGTGQRRVNFRLRDAGFSRQRYWGEPFPIVYSDDIPYPLDESELPVTLPDVESYQPTGTGESPIAAAEEWVNTPDGKRETDTMPGYAGSSWYFLRYMDPQNDERFVGKEAEAYWQNVDFYMGGAEHAVGHLLYARFWHKFLHDRGWISTEEPFKKMVNQGMIQGKSSIAYRVKGENKFVSRGLKDQYQTDPIHVDVKLVKDDVLEVQAAMEWSPLFKDADFILEEGEFLCETEVEKMSKSKYNVVNPDEIIAEYGADTFRMYEMFLGPIEQHKPWDTQGIDGVFKFLRKYWRLFFDGNGKTSLSGKPPTAQELKVLHQCIGKVRDDIERISFNTAVSAFMICVNELTALKCNKKAILKDLTILLAPFAPYITEEAWHRMGEEGSIHHATYPEFQKEYTEESTFEYPVSINGKKRTEMAFPMDAPKEEIEQTVLQNEIVQKWLEGKPAKKVIVVPKRIINVVV